MPEIFLMCRRLFLSIFVSLVVSVSALAQGNKIDPIGAIADPGASEALKKSLDAKGWRITIGEGPYCDIWLRSGVPTGKSDAQGAVYSLGESALIGVISISRATTDYRGQSVKPGTYTL